MQKLKKEHEDIDFDLSHLEEAVIKSNELTKQLAATAAIQITDPKYLLRNKAH